jgi:hypothetical protein
VEALDEGRSRAGECFLTGIWTGGGGHTSLMGPLAGTGTGFVGSFAGAGFEAGFGVGFGAGFGASAGAGAAGFSEGTIFGGGCDGGGAATASTVESEDTDGDEVENCELKEAEEPFRLS